MEVMPIRDNTEYENFIETRIKNIKTNHDIERESFDLIRNSIIKIINDKIKNKFSKFKDKVEPAVISKFISDIENLTSPNGSSYKNLLQRYEMQFYELHSTIIIPDELKNQLSLKSTSHPSIKMKFEDNCELNSFIHSEDNSYNITGAIKFLLYFIGERKYNIYNSDSGIYIDATYFTAIKILCYQLFMRLEFLLNYIEDCDDKDTYFVNIKKLNNALVNLLDIYIEFDHYAIKELNDDHNGYINILRGK